MTEFEFYRKEWEYMNHIKTLFVCREAVAEEGNVKAEESGNGTTAKEALRPREGVSKVFTLLIFITSPEPGDKLQIGYNSRCG